MFNLRFPRLLFAFRVVMLALFSASFAHANSLDSSVTSASSQPVLDVYKSPTCGCCEEWIDHLHSNGYQSKIHHPDDLNAIKNRYQIAPQFQSCHTAVSAEGYIFEGHIPAWVITRFLAEKPKDALGLAVPGMPVGSPGMEMGQRFTPYDVLLLKANGGSAVYTRITTLQQSH
ncbi:DUF411 domain-containing protein [Cellvibrio sp. OA-2007]|uniref:DUF411 domain-containing protein n=1 Tax=Cellvibrio sp. OA-2007 TaxID=529823 RepID=UPI000AF0E826|nr:DUF411 domain-containing protein [Cellvibrio sp. OA-2007]